jgi:hypothetical protein
MSRNKPEVVERNADKFREALKASEQAGSSDSSTSSSSSQNKPGEPGSSPTAASNTPTIEIDKDGKKVINHTLVTENIKAPIRLAYGDEKDHEYVAPSSPDHHLQVNGARLPDGATLEDYRKYQEERMKPHK